MFFPESASWSRIHLRFTWFQTFVFFLCTSPKLWSSALLSNMFVINSNWVNCFLNCLTVIQIMDSSKKEQTCVKYKRAKLPKYWFTSHLSLEREVFNMASKGINWAELLEKKYNSYTVEVEAFLETAHVSKSTEISIQNIYSAIRNDDKVDSNLKLLYHETIYGTNKEVKTRIRNRVSHFRRTLRWECFIYFNLLCTQNMNSFIGNICHCFKKLIALFKFLGFIPRSRIWTWCMLQTTRTWSLVRCRKICRNAKRMMQWFRKPWSEYIFKFHLKGILLISCVIYM